MIPRYAVIVCAALVCQTVAGLRVSNGLVAGRVVDGSSGVAIPDVAVSWTRAGTVSASGAVISDRNGQFALSGLPTEGPVSLKAAKAGYVGGRYNQQTPDGPSASFEFDPGTSRQDVTLRLWTSAAIAGKVVDEAGDVLVRVRVVALRRASRMAAGAFSVATGTTTDDQGNYRLVGLMPDSYVVAVVSGTDTALKSASGYPTTFFPNTVTLTEAIPITVRSGVDAPGVNFQLTARRSDRVTGIILGPDGNPVNAEVRVTPAESPDMPYGLEAADVLAGTDGRFSIDDIPLGRYVVRAVKGGLPLGGAGTTGGLARFARDLSPLPTASTATLLWGETTVDVSERATGNQTLQVHTQPGLRVSGRVLFEGPGPVPSGDDFLATPILILPADTMNDSAVRLTRIEADGTFATAELIPGRYVLSFMPLLNHVDAFQDWSIASMKCDGVEVNAQAIAVGGNRGPECVVRFGYRRKYAEVFGEVHNGQTATSDAVVYVVSTDRSRWSDLISFRQVAPGRRGAYRQVLVPGSYFVAAVRNGSPSEPGFVEWLATVGSRVVLHESQSVAQNLAVVVRGSR